MKCVICVFCKICLCQCCWVYTSILFLLWFLLCAKIDNILSKFKCIFVISYIKNSSQYLRGLFCLFLDHNKSGLRGSNPDANPAHAQRSLSQNLCHALGIRLQVRTGSLGPASQGLRSQWHLQFSVRSWEPLGVALVPLQGSQTTLVGFDRRGALPVLVTDILPSPSFNFNLRF